ncbi:MAG: ABC transporter permease [Parachlamydiaceae bacterium]|nr:ABC transporter permease [Parachlamydiaceae bacterium]
MISLAFKMLIGKQASCLGVIFGIFLATLLIAQQSAIFLGLIDRSYRIVTDISEPTIWVMDPVTESEEKLRSLPLGYVDVVKSIPGIEWAVPLSSALLPVISADGRFDITVIYGIDDATLIGAPTEMIEGSIRDLRKQGAVIVDIYSANSNLAKINSDGSKEPLKVGDTLEINEKHAVVVGICKVTPGFYPQPIIFTSFSQFNVFNPGMSNRASFILAKNQPSVPIINVIKEINTHSKLHAFTKQEFRDQIRDFFLKTGILINFGLSVLLGIIIGFSITGQIFYIMTLENIVYYALIKSVGGTETMILKMIIFQAAIVGVIGFVLGIGTTVLWGFAIQKTTLAFLFPWQLLAFTGLIILIICVFTAVLSIQKVFRVDPKVLMGT